METLIVELKKFVEKYESEKCVDCFELKDKIQDYQLLLYIAAVKFLEVHG